MKYLLLILAVLGVVVSSLALREHYRTYGDSPCSINERWDCGVVNHSPYAMRFGIPVAAIGIAGYILMGLLAVLRSLPLAARAHFCRTCFLALPGEHRSARPGCLVYLLRDFAGDHLFDVPFDAGNGGRAVCPQAVAGVTRLLRRKRARADQKHGSSSWLRVRT